MFLTFYADGRLESEGFLTDFDEVGHLDRPAAALIGDYLVVRTDAFGAHPVYLASTPDGIVCTDRGSRLQGAPHPVQLGESLLGDPDRTQTIYRKTLFGKVIIAGHDMKRRGSFGAYHLWRRACGDGTLRQRLARALERRLQPGAAVLLSGGLDSSLLLALAAPLGPVRAIIGDSDEATVATDLAQALGVPFDIVSAPDEALPAAFEATVLAIEEPIFNPLPVRKHLIARGAQALGATCLISGAGADELFIGNPLEASSPDDSAVVGPLLNRSLPTHHPKPMPRREQLWRITLPQVTLPAECRHGVDVRLPYLDPDVASLALSLPDETLVRDGLGKLPLRELAQGLVPEAVRTAHKTPRLAAMPRNGWDELFADLLSPHRLKPLPVDADAVGKLLVRWRNEVDPAVERTVMRLASLSVLAGCKPAGLE